MTLSAAVTLPVHHTATAKRIRFWMEAAAQEALVIYLGAGASGLCMALALHASSWASSYLRHGGH